MVASYAAVSIAPLVPIYFNVSIVSLLYHHPAVHADPLGMRGTQFCKDGLLNLMQS